MGGQHPCKVPTAVRLRCSPPRSAKGLRRSSDSARTFRIRPHCKRILPVSTTVVSLPVACLTPKGT